jgi:hypothetical protein
MNAGVDEMAATPGLPHRLPGHRAQVARPRAQVARQPPGQGAGPRHCRWPPAARTGPHDGLERAQADLPSKGPS